VLRDEIDELIIKRGPIVLGSGVPLFDGPFGPTGLVRTASRTFESGLDVTTYTR
jgi:dihydrofolate reductase